MRSLSPAEAALWAKVAATIRPLSRDQKDTDLEEVDRPDAIVAPAPARPRGRVPPLRPVSAEPRRQASLQAATLDGSWDRKLQSGDVRPDRTLDLHGHGLDRAWEAIDRALEAAINDGERVLLLITGHERKGEPPVTRGRIRAAVYDWLAASRHAPKIAAVRSAHRRHGGGGSLYIILRRA